MSSQNRPVDWAIYGVPFDTGVTYRPGARFGPRAIREASQYVKAYHVEHGVDVPGTLSIADAGDAPVKPYVLKKTLDAVAKWAKGLDGGAPSANGKARGRSAPSPMKLLAVGGDHSIAYANLRATWERQGKPRGGLALLHFDSHLDTVDAVWGEKWGHASPFLRAIEDGLVNPRAMISVGVKGPLNASADLDAARKLGVAIVTADEAREPGAAGVGPGVARLRRFVAGLKDRPVYVTFDIDAVDPAFAPGTGTPSVGGFTSAEALALVRACRGASVVGGDVVEVLPERDPAGITSFLAAHLVFEIIALDAWRRTR